MTTGLSYLYSRYMELDDASRQNFLSSIGATPSKAKHADRMALRDEPPQRWTAILYERMRTRLYDYQGIRLPALGSLKRLENQELDAAWQWLGGNDADKVTATGLVELTADAVAREIKPRRYGEHWLAATIQEIPEAVDRAYPGYKHNGILSLIAKSVGEGRLPIDIQSRDDDEHH